MTARKWLVRASRPHGSPRNPECWSTPAIASGCSDCSSSALSPPTNIEASPWTRAIGLSGGNQRSSALAQPLADLGAVGSGDALEDRRAERAPDVADDVDGSDGHGSV